MYDSNVVPAVLITGASTGIGEACALALVKLGYRVFAGVRRSADAQRLSKISSRMVPVLLDVTNPMQLQGVFEQVKREMGPAGLLGIVNNAGIAVAGPLEFVPIGELRKQFEVNVIGLSAVTQTFLPLLRQSHGRIVHIGSTSGLLAAPFNGPYAASKYAVEALADALRRELAGSGVQVALIEPGAIATPIWEKSSDHAERLLEGMPPEIHEYYGHALDGLRVTVAETSGRADPPELVARAVVHALTSPSPKTRYLIGSGARIQGFLAWLLPDRLLDWVLAKVMGIL